MSHLKSSGGFEENGDKSCTILKDFKSPLNDERTEDHENAIDPDGKIANGSKIEVNHEIHPNCPSEFSKELELFVSNSNDENRTIERYETGRMFYSYEELCESVKNGLTEPQLANHKEILFRLFFHTKFTELTSLMNKSDPSLNLDIHKSKIVRAQCNAIKNKQNGNFAFMPLPSPLSLVPLSLTNSKISKEIRNNYNIPRMNGKVMTSAGRSENQCYSLSELEAKVLTDFETSSIGKEAVATDNQQFSWFLNVSDNKHHALSSRQGMKKRKSFSSISLVYNECSMNAFAKWAFTSNDQKSSQILQSKVANFSESQSLMIVDFPAPIVSFRMCQLCKQWGHYELECTENLSSESITMINTNLNSKFTSEILKFPRNAQRDSTEYNQSEIIEQGDKSSNIALERDDTTSSQRCSICQVMYHMGIIDLSSQYFSKTGFICPECYRVDTMDQIAHITDIESCEGFVIEQKSFSSVGQSDVLLTETSGIDFERWSRVLVSVNGDTLNQISAKPLLSQSMPVFGQNQQLSIGEFCWAKREHAPSGKVGRDEWWPAQVISLINTGKQVPYFSVEVTPYLVKMYGAAANRVRASSTLPFFRNFRNIAMKRLNTTKHSKSSIDRKFRKGVMEIISLIGFKSVEHALIRADEIAKKEESDIQGSRKRTRSEKFPNSICKSFKIDGFHILARKHITEDYDLEETSQQGNIQSKEGKSDKDCYKQAKLVGCCVAWIENDKSKRQLNVGTVLAANIETKMALVAAIPYWKSKIKPAKSADGAMVQNYDALGTEWMSMEQLHVLSVGKEEFLREELSQGIIANLLSAARLELKDKSNNQNTKLQLDEDPEICDDNGAKE
jgi:hypothetical protein